MMVSIGREKQVVLDVNDGFRDSLSTMTPSAALSLLPKLGSLRTDVL